MFPHLFDQWRGEALSRGEREIRDEVSFQASWGFCKQLGSCGEPESLPSRIYRTLDGVPRNGKLLGGNIKMRLQWLLVAVGKNSRHQWGYIKF